MLFALPNEKPPIKRCHSLAPTAAPTISARLKALNGGTLTGYGGDLWRKQRLLEIEQHYKNQSQKA